MLRFQHIEYLFALAAIPIMLLLFLFVIKWKKRASARIGDNHLVKVISGNYSGKRFSMKFVLFLIAFCLTVIALTNLRIPGKTEKITRSGIDLMIALDVSKSMLARDIKPSRLEKAKQLVGKLIDKLGNDRIGIVVFAGKAYLQMPLTADHSAARMYLSTASPDIVPTQGTVIADALQMCASSFQTGEKKYRSVLLISDGEDHDEDALTIAGQLAEQGILINTIGIGSTSGTTIIDEVTREIKKDNQGNVVVTKLNEEELRNIAAKGNGIYQFFTDPEEIITRITSQLEGMGQRAVTEDSQTDYINLFPYFLGLTLIFLVLEIFVPEWKRMGRLGQDKPIVDFNIGSKTLVLCFLIPIPCFLFAQSDKMLIKKGNEAYAGMDYKKAAVQYRKALDKNPSNAVALYNMGNALYKNNKADEAINSYENATAFAVAAEERSAAFYNKGVVLQNNRKVPECISAYKNALKLNPVDEDARQNLQKALQQQQQQKQNKEQKNSRQNQKDKEKQQPKDNNKKNDQQKPQNSKLSKQDAEEKLKALLQQEKNLQDKLKKINEAGVDKPEKDW